MPGFWSGKEVRHRALRQTQDCLTKESLTDTVLTQNLLGPSSQVICVEVGILIKLKKKGLGKPKGFVLENDKRTTHMNQLAPAHPESLSEGNHTLLAAQL